MRGTRGTEPWTHLLEGIESGIECIWFYGNNLEGEPGELNPGITFLVALSLGLNTPGSLGAVWKGTEPWTHLLKGTEPGIECIWASGSNPGAQPGELNPGITFWKALSLVLNTSGSLAAVWKEELCRELNPGLTFLKALSLVLKKSGSLAAAWKESQRNQPRIHLLKGIVLDIECIWVPGSSPEGELRELNPVLTFLKALSLVLKKSGYLAAAWKESQRNQPRIHLLKGTQD